MTYDEVPYYIIQVAMILDFPALAHSTSMCVCLCIRETLHLLYSSHVLLLLSCVALAGKISFLITLFVFVFPVLYTSLQCMTILVFLGPEVRFVLTILAYSTVYLLTVFTFSTSINFPIICFIFLNKILY